jgi:hypothetical protein
MEGIINLVNFNSAKATTGRDWPQGYIILLYIRNSSPTYEKVQESGVKTVSVYRSGLCVFRSSFHDAMVDGQRSDSDHPA